MKKLFSLILAAALLLSLAACGEETDPTEAPSEPDAAATESTEETAPAVVVTADVDTVILRGSDESLRNSYALIAIDPGAAFVDIMNNPVTTEIPINDTGADALVNWLLSEEARTTAGQFGVSEYGKAVFSLEGTVSTLEEASGDGETPGTLRFFAPEEIIASGLLEELLPAFEEAHGCTVELHTADTNWAVNNARRGKADLLLVRTQDLDAAFLEDGFARIVEGFDSLFLPYLYNYDVLCGPVSDPAAVQDAASLRDAFSSIAYRHCTFVSHSADSRIHALELKFWPAALGITGEASSYEPYALWYVGSGTEMGPALVMAEEMGGYILTDYLTFLKFDSYIRAAE